MCGNWKDCRNCTQQSDVACSDCRDSQYFVCGVCSGDFRDCKCVEIAVEDE